MIVGLALALCNHRLLTDALPVTNIVRGDQPNRDLRLDTDVEVEHSEDIEAGDTQSDEGASNDEAPDASFDDEPSDEA
jgi:hypothetical protein